LLAQKPATVTAVWDLEKEAPGGLWPTLTPDQELLKSNKNRQLSLAHLQGTWVFQTQLGFTMLGTMQR